MAVATTIPRYNKKQIILVDDREITLIDHLKKLRTAKKITKKKISNIIKQNDYWYSQIERDGKNGDDDRQKTIYKPDLINIISIVKYGANSISELKEFHKQSELYLDKEIHAVPLTESIKKLEWYQINNLRTEQEQNNLFESLLASITKLIRQTYVVLSTRADKDLFLNALKEINSSLKIDPIFLIILAGQPLSNFLYEADEEQITTLIKNISSTIDEFSQHPHIEDVNTKYYFDQIKQVLDKYTTDSSYLRRKNYELLPNDEISF